MPHNNTNAPVLRPEVLTRPKLEGGRRFVMKTEFTAAGDQPTAIAELTQGVNQGERDQVLLGATGTGKTFTMAKVIEETQRPAIILAPNKTLAAQLYGEFKNFFPDNAVEYFVSYYDYYQPEAYVARSDTYIEKESQINEQIDRMRHSATRALLERDDVIIVASVSCIYGIGSVETYSAMTQDLKTGECYDQRKVMADLIAQAYRRNDAAFQRGSFRVRGDSLEIWPAHQEDRAWRFSFFGEELESITEFDPLTGAKTDTFDQIRIYANSHYVTPGPTMKQAIQGIKTELKQRLDQLVNEGKLLEAQRLEQRTNFDLEMLEATGVCNGIENYSRYLTGRAPGEPPAHAVRIHPRQCHRLRRRIPRLGPPDRRHVQGRLPAQDDAGRTRLPPAVLHGQPPPEVRGMGRHAPAIRVRLRHPRRVGAGANRRRLHRTGHPPHRPDRPADRNPPRRNAGRRPARRGPQGRRRPATAPSSPR